MSILAGIKEFFRKRIVQIKRKPQLIPLIFIIICCMIYTFKLSNYSNAAIYAKESWVAVLVFLTTLLSILSIFTYMGAFDRKKIKRFMVVLAVIQLIALFIFDILCYNAILSNITVNKERVELVNAVSDLKMHVVFLAITIVLVVLKPLYQKLLQKISTVIADDEFKDENNDVEIELVD